MRPLSSALRLLNPGKINVTGCSTLSYPNGNGKKDGDNLLNQISKKTGNPFIFGTTGAITVGTTYEDPTFMIYIEPGGRLSQPPGQDPQLP